MGPRKQLESCWLEKEGPFPMGHTGRSTERVNNMTHPFKHAVVHLQVWLLLPNYADTSAHTYKQLKGVLLWDTLLEHPEQDIKVKTIPPKCGDTSRPPWVRSVNNVAHPCRRPCLMPTSTKITSQLQRQFQTPLKRLKVSTICRLVSVQENNSQNSQNFSMAVA